MNNFKRAYEAMAGFVNGELPLVGAQSTYAPQAAAREDDINMRLMQHAWVFEVPPFVAENLVLTRDPVRPDVHLPFPTCWLEGTFKWKSRTFYGLLLYEYWTDGRGGPSVMQRDGSFLATPPMGKNGVPMKLGIKFAAIYVEEPIEKDGVMYEPVGLSAGTLGHESPITHETGEQQNDVDFEDEMQFLSEMCMSFVDLVQTPQVKLNKSERPPNNLQRKRSQYGVPIPKMTVRLVLERALREGLEANLDPNSGKHYSHSFWVRGHWRVLQNEARYKENTGRRIWIPAFRKGTGILLKKNLQIPEETPT